RGEDVREVGEGGQPDVEGGHNPDEAGDEDDAGDDADDDRLARPPEPLFRRGFGRERATSETAPEAPVHPPEDEQVEQEYPRADPEEEPQAVRIAYRGLERLLAVGLVERTRRQAELHGCYEGVVAGGQHQDRPAEAHAQTVDVAEENGGQDDGRHPGDQKDYELRPQGSQKEPGYRYHNGGAGQTEERQRHY